jgi:hypothetical protein
MEANMKADDADSGQTQSQRPSTTTQVNNADNRVVMTRHTLMDLDRSLFLLFRRIYHIYFLLLAFIFLFVFGINAMLQALFSLYLHHVSIQADYAFVAVALICMILLLAYFVASLLNACYLLIEDAWNVDEFITYRRIVTFDDGLFQRTTKPGSLRAAFDRGYQIFILLSFDVLPIAIGIIYAMFVSSSDGLDMFFATAMLVAVGHSSLFWLASLVKDYVDKIRDVHELFGKQNYGARMIEFLGSSFLRRLFFTEEEEGYLFKDTFGIALPREVQRPHHLRRAVAAVVPVDDSNNAAATDVEQQNHPPESLSSSLYEKHDTSLATPQTQPDAQQQHSGRHFDIQPPPHPRRLLYNSAAHRYVDDPRNDALNFCVSVFDLSVHPWFRAALIGLCILIIAAVLVYSVIANIPAGIMLAALAIVVGLVVLALRFLLTNVKTRIETLHHSELWRDLRIFFFKHSGIHRYFILRFVILLCLFALILSVGLGFFKLWTTLAVTGVMTILLVLCGCFAYWSPRSLWLIVVLQCSLFSAVAIASNFVIFGYVIGTMAAVLVLFTQGFLARKFRGFFIFYGFVLFCFLLFALALFTVGYLAATQNATVQKSGPTGYARSANPYSFCGLNLRGLTVSDYAFFSQLAYQKDADFAVDVDRWFPQASTGWTLIAKVDDGVRYYHFENLLNNNLTVIAVRGTADVDDAIQDIDIWASVAFFQLASYVGPSFESPVLPDIIYWSSFLGRMLKETSGKVYYSGIESYVSNLKNTRNASQIVLTGHSLGGGVAQIVGAKQEIVAVTFSSPGLYYTSKSVDVSINKLRKSAWTIKPARDIVVRVDSQGGTVLPIECDASVPACHKMTRTLCEIVRSCGDSRGVNPDLCPA